MSNIIIPRQHQAAPKGTRMLVPNDNEVNELDLPETKAAKLESWIARNIGNALVKVYPGREWRVHVDIFNGVAIVCCPMLASDKGYHIHLGGRTIKELQKVAVRGAGEILERFGISRGKAFNADNVEALIEDAKGNKVSKDSAPESITGSRIIVPNGTH